MTVQAPEAPAAPSAEPAAPAAPAPAVPAQQAPPVPAPPAPVPAPPAQPRAADGTFTAPQPPPAAPAAPADPTDWKAAAEAARAEAARLKQEADQWKAQSRRQEARSKLNHQELQNRDALLRLVAEKVGVEFDDRPDPEVLQQRLEQQTTLARQRAVELAVYTQAAQAGTVNAVALLDSRDFMTRTSALDPEAADFPSQVADLVREAAGQPRYQFQQPPAPPAQAEAQQQAPVQPPAPQPPAPSSGADFSGAPGQGSQWTQADYDRYMAGAAAHDRDGKVLSKAIQDGLLVNLGIGRPKQRSRR